MPKGKERKTSKSQSPDPSNNQFTPVNPPRVREGGASGAGRSSKSQSSNSYDNQFTPINPPHVREGGASGAGRSSIARGSPPDVGSSSERVSGSGNSTREKARSNLTGLAVTLPLGDPALATAEPIRSTHSQPHGAAIRKPYRNAAARATEKARVEGTWEAQDLRIWDIMKWNHTQASNRLIASYLGGRKTEGEVAELGMVRSRPTQEPLRVAWTDPDRKIFREMRAEGRSTSDIARRLTRSKEEITKACKSGY